MAIPQTILIIRHAEKPGTYGSQDYKGIDALGKSDEESLVTLGWERAGALASLFDPQSPLQASAATLLATPTVIYASDPNSKHKHPSQRPYQTISALSSKLNITPNITFKKDDYAEMVKDVLTNNQASDIVLICWQHQDILVDADKGATDSIVNEIITQSQSPISKPDFPWPGNRYDMVLVFEQTQNGTYTVLSQVPQMLLAGDITTPLNG
jgi:hypothetical protein